MNVQQLIDKLMQIEDKRRIVVLQKDSEGNGYGSLRDIDDNAVYSRGEVKIQRLTDDLRQHGFEDEDVGGGEACLVLYP